MFLSKLFAAAVELKGGKVERKKKERKKGRKEGKKRRERNDVKALFMSRQEKANHRASYFVLRSRSFTLLRVSPHSPLLLLAT